MPNFVPPFSKDTQHGGATPSILDGLTTKSTPVSGVGLPSRDPGDEVRYIAEMRAKLASEAVQRLDKHQSSVSQAVFAFSKQANK